MRFNTLFLYILLFFVFGCTKKTIQSDVNVNVENSGYLVLNEGLFNQNNASLSWYDSKTNTITQNVFQIKNQRDLGDTGNDIIKFGNKIFIVVNVSSTIEVLNANSLISIKQIPMVANNIPKQPRNIIGYGNKVYVSCFDGYVDVIDTATLQIEKRIKVGKNPENLCLLNNFLLVSNSGGLNPPSMDSTLSMIDLSTNLELKKIFVGTNPGTIIKGLNDCVYVITRGNYNTIVPDWKMVNIKNEVIEKVFEGPILSLESFQDSLLLLNRNNKHIELISMNNNLIKNQTFISLETMINPYNIQYFSKTKEICVTDANGYVNQGYVSVFDDLGNFKVKFKSGINPSKIIRYE